MTERLLIVWPPGASVRPGAGPGGRWPIFRGGFPSGHVTAGAVAQRDASGVWRWVRASPEVDWFLHQTVENIKLWLKGPATKRGWRWRWASCFEIA